MFVVVLVVLIVLIIDVVEIDVLKIIVTVLLYVVRRVSSSSLVAKQRVAKGIQ